MTNSAISRADRPAAVAAGAALVGRTGAGSPAAAAPAGGGTRAGAWAGPSVSAPASWRHAGTAGSIRAP
ncbi:hypothetical protein ACFUJR_05315 [Streptomyces sp. NPDC057271]|uniref:hypothetical protein n=1 Tax=unclassified Streptomyces TaxID=2593676 RepID=UPI00362FCDAC